MRLPRLTLLISRRHINDISLNYIKNKFYFTTLEFPIQNPAASPLISTKLALFLSVFEFIAHFIFNKLSESLVFINYISLYRN